MNNNTLSIRSIAVFFLLFVFFSGVARAVTPNPGWWWNPAEGGRGYVIEAQDNMIFMATYMYAPSGRATWYAAGPAAMTGSTFIAPLTTYVGGQTLTGAYRSSSGTVNNGNVNVTFTDANHGTLTWPSGLTTPIERYNIVAGGSGAPQSIGTPQAGWWWNAAEGGRGFSVEIQNSTMFMAGYMYDDAGNPIWYASGPAPMTDANTYIGNWQQYGNGQILAGAYKPAALVNADVGSLKLIFDSATSATLTLPDGRTIALTRFAYGPATSNPNATAPTKSLLNYFATLSKQSSNKIVSGQHVGMATVNIADWSSTQSGYDNLIVKLQSQTGKTVGLAGADYGSNDPNYVISGSMLTSTNAALIRHWGSGGLVTVMFSARNPWSKGVMSDRTGNSQLADILKVGTAANASWMAQLDGVAAGLKELRDAGVVVLFRPLHEVNGAWFWWGSNPSNPTVQQDVTNVWRHMHDYFTNKHGLDNLLWVYSVSANTGGAMVAEDYFYPGSQYVDIVGIDIYATSFDSAALNGYQVLKNLKKPVALTEFGLTKIWPGNYDYATLVSEIKKGMPDIVYFMAWNDFFTNRGSTYFSLVSNRNAIGLLNDPWVVTADEIPASARATSGIATSVAKTISAVAAVTTASSMTQCYTSSNVAHVLAGRAYDKMGYALASGSNQNMGMDNTFFVTTLKKVVANYFVLGSCP
ncbi:MAG: hypothetical protein HYS18_03960 [Burkholderiales bacterium]|nr:hypothetical protein [Burkholderiales bacterium]